MIKTKLFILLPFVVIFTTAAAQKSSKGTKRGPKFLDDIEINVGGSGTTEPVAKGAAKKPVAETTLHAPEEKFTVPYNENSSIEKATAIQLKYALLLNAEVETVQNTILFSLIDEWWGTRYRLGGADKSGIDCSAFTQVLCSGVSGIQLPRTAREQFQALRPVSINELKEGDLVFFNTGGGVSHVGYYLQNNKFVHASSSEGVTISDLKDSYWSKRIVGTGRYEETVIKP